MKWIYDDGGRAAAGFQGKTGDCGVRAIAIAAQLPYAEVYRTAKLLMKEMGKGTSPRDGMDTKVMHEYMRILGWSWTATMKIGSGCQVHMDPKELPPGRLILRVSKHYCAVIDGVLHDTFNSSERGTTIYPPGTPEKDRPKGARWLENGNGWAYDPQRCVYGYWKEIL